MKIKTLKLLCAASMSLMLAACGGGAGSALENTINGINNTSSTGTQNTANSSSGAIDTISPAYIGKGEGSSFVKGAIDTDKPSATLSAGGTAVLTINVVSATNSLVTSPVEVTFNSPCFAKNEAILKVGTTLTNKVTVANGSASIAYVANGCVGSDEVTASASINNKVVYARLTINIASDSVQSIKFVDTTPAQISLAGTGGTETSVVRFQVVGSTGAPMKDVAVTFDLSTTVGGMNLTNSSLKTDGSGYASTTVQAGNIHTAVRVTATATASLIFTTSSQLIVSTGIPDQDSMTLAPTDTHPVGGDIDGVTSTITVRLSDAFNNPPPLNTNVAFRTEGGSIIDGCLTNAAGSCSAIWTSQDPRPTRNANDSNLSADQLVLRKLCRNADGSEVADYLACALERAGRITILATAIGNESFIDTNGNGIFDKDDIFKTAADGGNCNRNVPYSSGEIPENSNIIPCDDLSEAYLDKNENKVRDGNEEFVDFTSVAAEGIPDNLYTTGNGKYNGVLCLDESSGLCSRSQVTIRQDTRLVLTTSGILKYQKKLPFIDDALIAAKLPAPAVSTTFLLADDNGNGIAQGTKLEIDTSHLSNASAFLSNEGPLLANDDPTGITVTVAPNSNTAAPSGVILIKIKITTVLGEKTETHSISVTPAP